MGKVIDLDERRQVHTLHRAMVDSMARLVRLSRRYRDALVELHGADRAKATPADPDRPPPQPRER